MKRYILAIIFVLYAGSSYADADIYLDVGASEIHEMPRNAYKVLVGNTNVARVKKLDYDTISVHGKRSGWTELKFLTKSGKVIEKIAVHVGNIRRVGGINAAIEKLFPNQDISVKTTHSSVIVSGLVSDAEIAERVMQMVRNLVKDKSNLPEGVSENPKIVNLMQLTSGQQVMLRVRIGEVQRGALTQLGLGLGGLGGNMAQSKMFDISATLETLERNGVMKVLAEPNLTAISGETAKFLAGGEFPIPVAQGGGNYTVEYKPFGVGVEFTPLVLSENRIRLTVEPEVSELSKQGEISSINGMKLPALSSRRAKTTVELAPGESFVIAGLMKDDIRQVVDEMPALANVPIIGVLFRNSAFKRNETELVIAVTPYLVNPVAARDVRLPTDDFRPAAGIETYFFGALGSLSNRREVLSKVPGYDGPFGYITD